MAARFRWSLRPGTPAPSRVRQRTQVLLGILPFLLMALVSAADVLEGPGTGFLPLLSLGPALAAVSLRPLQTALTGGLALAACAALASYDDLASSRRGIIALLSIAGVTAAGALASAGRQRRERELANLKAVAETAQRVLLRPVPAAAGEFRFAVRYISASASARIGGDLYEVISTGNGVRLLIGDVQGKGLAAVQTAGVVLGAFREAAHDAPGLPALAARVEQSLQRQASEEEFVTAILAQTTATGDAIEILNCGHPPPLLLLAGGQPARFAEPSEAGLPLGLGTLSDAGRHCDVIPLSPGDRILFYTDGISEARDKSGVFYHLAGCAAMLRGAPDTALGRLCADVIRHVGHELLDDAAMLLLSREPAPARTRGMSGPRIELTRG
jgi:serine phosphatase RsbU (regulator of sigma subunit)